MNANFAKLDATCQWHFLQLLVALDAGDTGQQEAHLRALCDAHVARKQALADWRPERMH